jgi:hypothetical protein
VNKQRGWGLSELLVGLFLSGLISTVLIQTYLTSKHQFLALHDDLERHFDIQWVQDLLTDSIRRAGFTPCLRIDQLELINRGTLPGTTLSLEISVAPQHSFTVHRMSEQFAELLSAAHPQNIVISSDITLRAHQSILIADCEHAEVHEVVHIKKSAEGFIVTLAKPLYFTYPSLTYVGRWIEEQWSIKKNNAGKNALYYKHIHSEELTSLIHSMNIKKTRVQNKNKVEITLGFGNKHTRQLSVFVRS